MQFAKVLNKTAVLRNTLYSRRLQSNFSNYGKTTLIYPPKPNLITKSSFSSDNEAMNIFDRKAKILQRDRSATFPESAEYDYLKDEVAKRLADRLEDILTHKFPTVLDLGSGTGLLAKYIQDERIGMQTLYQLELSEKQLFRDSHLDSNLERVKPIRILGDEEFLPFAGGSMDLVISNMNLHWVNDLPGTFAQVKSVLKPDGLFLGAMLGEGSLRELRDAFTLAEQERDGGLSPHVSPFAAVGDVGNLLTRAKFSLPTVDTESITIRYADPFVLMRDLQGMAENNAVLKRRKSMSKDTIMAAASVYQSLYGYEDGSVPATFQIVYFIAWTPHESQPKPKQRGSASVSMKSLGQSTEKLH